jgi:hypothetical protein
MAETKLTWIKERIAEGRTVYLTTYLRATKITAKHLQLIRVRNNALEVCHGKKWLDYNGARLTAN